MNDLILTTTQPTNEQSRAYRAGAVLRNFGLNTKKVTSKGTNAVVRNAKDFWSGLRNK